MGKLTLQDSLSFRYDFESSETFSKILIFFYDFLFTPKSESFSCFDWGMTARTIPNSARISHCRFSLFRSLAFFGLLVRRLISSFRFNLRKKDFPHSEHFFRSTQRFKFDDSISNFHSHLLRNYLFSRILFAGELIWRRLSPRNKNPRIIFPETKIFNKESIERQISNIDGTLEC